MSISGTKAKDVVKEEAKETKRPKVKLPDFYTGDRSKLKAFFSQVELYIGFHPDEFVLGIDKVLWTVSFLRGAAALWIEPFLHDCLTNRNDKGNITTGAKKVTQTIFVLYIGFKEEVTKVFGDIDGEKIAEHNLQKLR
jgi:hypothetical protein